MSLLHVKNAIDVVYNNCNYYTSDGPHLNNIMGRVDEYTTVKAINVDQRILDSLNLQSATYSTAHKNFYVNHTIKFDDYELTSNKVRNALVEIAKPLRLESKIGALIADKQKSVIDVIDDFRKLLTKDTVDISKAGQVIGYVRTLKSKAETANQKQFCTDLFNAITRKTSSVLTPVIILPLLAFAAWTISKFTSATQQA